MGLAKVAFLTGVDIKTCFVAFTKCELQDLTEKMKVWFVMVRMVASHLASVWMLLVIGQMSGCGQICPCDIETRIRNKSNSLVE